MKKKLYYKYTSNSSMIASGIVLSLIGVLEHQIGWILFGVPVSLIYIASWLYTQKKGYGNRQLFDAMLMILVVVAAATFMVCMIKGQRVVMVVSCIIVILTAGFALYKIIRHKSP